MNHDKNAVPPGLYLSRTLEWSVRSIFVKLPSGELSPVVNRLSGGFGNYSPGDAPDRIPVPEPTSRAWMRALEEYRPSDRSQRDYDHVAGCLLGGAVGDALGAPISALSLAQIRQRFGPAGLRNYVPINGLSGTLSWHTQLSLFTAEALIRAKNRGDIKGIGGAAPHSILYAYRRWMTLQGDPVAAYPGAEIDGWLVTIGALGAHRGVSQTVRKALHIDPRQDLLSPINTSKGAGALPRATVVGIGAAAVGFKPYDLGVLAAAITHGHPTAWHTAGFLATLINALLEGQALPAAVDVALTRLRREPEGGDCVAAVEKALALAATGSVQPEQLATLGNGRAADEALAIALACALSATDVEQGIVLAANHSGDSDITASLTGAILGALHGRWAIPGRWLADLELRAVIEDVARDLFCTVSAWPEAYFFSNDIDRYPG